MDEFSLIVLEDTLQFATEVLPPELVSEYISCIRDLVNVVGVDRSDYHSARKLRDAMKELSNIARDNNKFLVETRLQSIARQFDVPDVA